MQITDEIRQYAIQSLIVCGAEDPWDSLIDEVLYQVGAAAITSSDNVHTVIDRVVEAVLSDIRPDFWSK